MNRTRDIIKLLSDEKDVLTRKMYTDMDRFAKRVNNQSLTHTHSLAPLNEQNSYYSCCSLILSSMFHSFSFFAVFRKYL